MVSEAHYLVLVVLPCEETLPRGIVHALLDPALHAHDGLGATQVLIRLEGHVAEQDSDVLSLQNAVIVKVIPVSHTSTKGEERRCKQIEEEKFG